MAIALTSRPERFDVYDSSGHFTGRTQRRDIVHRSGSWHRAFHCWIVVSRDEASPSILLQRRSAMKDTWPNRLDVSVGGHFSAGETINDVLREMAEEVGQTTTLSSLVHLGRRVSVNAMQPGVRDNELQEVYLWQSPVRFGEFQPDPQEVSGLALVAISDMIDLAVARTVRAVPCRLFEPHEGGPNSHAATQSSESTSITLDDFIPSLDNYLRRAVVAIDLAVRGYPYPTI